MVTGTVQTRVPDPVGEALTWAAITLRECRNVSFGRIIKVGMFKEVLCTEVGSTFPECLMGVDIMSGCGALPLARITKPKPVDEVLMGATVRNVRVHGIKVTVCRRIGMFEQALCEVFVSLLPDGICGMDPVSDWGAPPLHDIVKQKACKSALGAIGIVRAERESDCLGPHSVD